VTIFGNSAETAWVVAEFQESIRDADEGPGFWLALAAVQWQTGRVVTSVLKNALAAIGRKMRPRWPSVEAFSRGFATS
jgi:hypothetical protein